MKAAESKHLVIEKMPFLIQLSEQEKRLMTDLLHRRIFQAHEEIYQENRPSAAAYYIIEGSVGLFRKYGHEQPERVAYCRPSQWFGYSALLSDRARDANARALEKTQVLALFRTDFLRLADSHCRCAYKILASITSELLKDYQETQQDYFALTRKLIRAHILV